MGVGRLYVLLDQSIDTSDVDVRWIFICILNTEREGLDGGEFFHVPPKSRVALADFLSMLAGRSKELGRFDTHMTLAGIAWSLIPIRRCMELW
jgi:hypothetical protein